MTVVVKTLGGEKSYYDISLYYTYLEFRSAVIAWLVTILHIEIFNISINIQGSEYPIVTMPDDDAILYVMIIQKDESQNRALMDAALNSNNPIIKETILNGADPNIEVIDNSSGRINCRGKYLLPVIQYVIKNGNTYMIRFLIAHGLNLDYVKCDSWGYPLAYAISMNYKKIPFVMLEYIHEINNNCKSALHAACRISNIPIIKTLLKKEVDIDEFFDDDYNKNTTALFESVNLQYYKIVQILLQNNADPNKKCILDGVDYSPLNIACLNLNIGIVHLLLKYGASVNTTDNYDSFYNRCPYMDNDWYKNQYTLLYINCCFDNGNETIIQLLLNYGENIDTQMECNGYTALHIACENNNINVVKLLLKNNANLNIQNENGDTPLHIATKLTHLDIAKMLLKAGARTDIQDNDGYTSIEYASSI